MYRRAVCMILAAGVVVSLAGCGRWPWKRKAPDMLEATTEDREPFEGPSAGRTTTTRPVSVRDISGGRETDRPASGAETQEPAVESSQTGEDREVIAGSILQVNDQFITVKDVLRGTRVQLMGLPAGVSEQTFRRKARQIISEELRKQATEALVLVEARRELTEAQEQRIQKEVEQGLRAMITDADGSRKKLEHRLLNQGTNLEAALADYRNNLTIRTYLRAKFYPHVEITRRMLLDEYRRKKSQYSSPKKVQMQIICAVDKSFLSKVPTQPADNRELLAKGLAKGRIAEAVRALAAGDDFADVAKRLSSGTKANSGGLWPLMAKGNFRYENVERAAFELVEGQVSDVIETESGYYIVKAAKVVPAEVVSFEEAQRQIEWDLRQQQYQKLTEQHFQRLMDQATIVQSDRFVALAVDRAVKEHWGQ